MIHLKEFGVNENEVPSPKLWKTKPPVPSAAKWDRILGHIAHVYRVIEKEDPVKKEYVLDTLLSIGQIAANTSSDYSGGKYEG